MALEQPQEPVQPTTPPPPSQPESSPYSAISLALGSMLIPLFSPILAIVFGVMARKRGEQASGMAIAGIILGTLSILVVLALIGFYAAIIIAAITSGIMHGPSAPLPFLPK